MEFIYFFYLILPVPIYEYISSSCDIQETVLTSIFFLGFGNQIISQEYFFSFLFHFFFFLFSWLLCWLSWLSCSIDQGGVKFTVLPAYVSQVVGLKASATTAQLFFCSDTAKLPVIIFKCNVADFSRHTK